MTTQTKHVIFYCDDCTLLDPVITVFKAAEPDIVIQTTSEVEDLILKVRSNKPEMVLVYLHDPQETYVNVLREIREHVDFSSIEVVIYRQLPDEKELELTFKKALSKTKHV